MQPFAMRRLSLVNAAFDSLTALGPGKTRPDLLNDELTTGLVRSCTCHAMRLA
jgi:hypothetical protein